MDATDANVLLIVSDTVINFGLCYVLLVIASIVVTPSCYGRPHVEIMRPPSASHRCFQAC